jgi:iron complex outermembrane receptor protein
MGEAALINYAFGDIPTRLVLDNHMYRGVLGFKGDGAGWDWQVTADVNHGVLDTTAAGFIYQPQLIADVTDGTYSFINPSTNSAAVRNALAPTLHKTSTTDLDALDASGTRDLWTLPGGPLRLAIGGQVRYEATHNPDINTNDLVQGGDGAMQPAFTFGHRTVEGIFGELEAPVVKQLTVNVSGRYDHYSDVGGHFSPKVGVKFTPIRQLVLRGTYSQGFRAPSFSESGNSAVIGYVSYSPCPSPSAAQTNFDNAHGGCASNNPYILTPYNLNISNVGNPAIKPETSRSYTVGAILEPIRQFSVSVDYYNIRKKNVIGPPDSGPILDDYFAGTPLPANVTVIADAPDPQNPGALPRPLVIEGPWVNSNQIYTSGIDIDARAQFTMPHDIRWTSELNFSDIFHFYYTTASATYDYVGTEAPYILSSGAGTPKYRGNWTNSFTIGRLNLTGTLYYVSPIKQTGVDLTGLPAPCLYSGPTGAPLPTDCTVKAFWDFDLTGRYKINDQVEIYAAVANLFDASAPLNPANYSGGYNGNGFNYNPTYEQAGAIGRAFRVGVHFKY